MNPWITNLLIPLILAIAPMMMGYVIWLLQEEKKTTEKSRELTAKELNAIKQGVKLELRRDIIEEHNRYVIDGEPMLPLAYENLCEVFNAYIALGGNGMTKKLMDEIEKVRVEKGGIQ